tara:strand:- start:415 stop:3804 length:3390 start_codon:yes stop_codon:yes gene_type:complete
MRLLIGASFILGLNLGANKFSDSTFLFCLESDENPLSIRRDGNGFRVDNIELDRALHKTGVLNIEPWISSATDRDRYKDVYLNRIYRVYIDKDRGDVRSAMSFLNSMYSFLYIEHENIHELHYQPNDPSYDQQCSISSVKADKAWGFWDIASGIVPDGQEVLLASVDTGVDYTHPDLKASIWINQEEIPELVWEIVLDLGADLNSDGQMSSLEIENFLIMSGMDNNGDGEINLRDLVYENDDNIIGANTSVFLDGVDQDGNGFADDIIGWDPSGTYSMDDADPYPREGASTTGTWAHGTHVAGILGATTDNGVGMASTAYNAKIISVKVSRDYQQTDPGINDGYDGITYAAKAGHRDLNNNNSWDPGEPFTIINNSWGGGGYSFSENTVIQNAHSNYGAVILSSAGNGDDPQGYYSEEYPAAYDNVLSISAIGCSGNWGGWATYHESVDLAAPGENILSTVIGEGYDSWDGSSMASPNAASVIGLLRSYYPDWSNDQLIDRILFSSDDFIYDLNPDYVDCPDNSGNPVVGGYCIGVGMVDAYKAIGMDFSPNIRLQGYDYEVTDGDGDSVLNPGDSFNLFITLDNEADWASAQNVSVQLEASSDLVEISENSLFISNFISGESYTNESPIQVQLNSSMGLEDVEFYVAVSATGADGYQYSESLFFNIPVSLFQEGFPYDTNSQIGGSPLTVDLDGDGSLEIIFGDYAGLIHVLNTDGQSWNPDIFPYDIGDDIWGSASSADIDLDGNIDFLVGSTNDYLYCFDQFGLKFDYEVGQPLIGTPAIGNIDSDDELEVVVGGYSSSGDLFAVNHDGTSVEGFPVEVNDKIRSVALRDFDDNGLDDIVITTDGDDIMAVIYDDLSLEVLFTAGNKFKSSPSLLKVGDDYAVMAGSYDDSMHAVSISGEILFQIEVGENVNSSTSFVDLGGVAYAFFGADDGFVYAVDMNGDPLNGWPKDLGGGVNISTSVSFSDLDGDGVPEAIIGVSGKLYAFYMDGSLYDKFPISYEFAFTGTPTIVDLDEDGDLEILLGSSGSLVAVDIMEAGTSDGYWNQDRANNKRDGYYEISGSECVDPMSGDVNCDGEINISDIVLMVNYIVNMGQLSEYELWASDINQDQIVDILDVIVAVNLILG